MNKHKLGILFRHDGRMWYVVTSQRDSYECRSYDAQREKRHFSEAEIDHSMKTDPVKITT